MHFSIGMRHDNRTAIKSVKTTVRVLYGDRKSNLKSIRVYADLLPNAKFQAIKGAGRFFLVDAPADFSREVRAFLGRLE